MRVIRSNHEVFKKADFIEKEDIPGFANSVLTKNTKDISG